VILARSFTKRSMSSKMRGARAIDESTSRSCFLFQLVLLAIQEVLGLLQLCLDRAESFFIGLFSVFGFYDLGCKIFNLILNGLRGLVVSV